MIDFGRSRRIVAVLAAALVLTACASDRPATTADGSAAPPPQPTEPAEAVELVRPLESWGGAGGAVDIESSMRAATAEEWDTLWDLVGLTPPRELAVGREVAAGIFLGERPTGGYGIEIIGMRAQPTSSAVVWRERMPPQDAVVTQAATRPWQIAVFPAEAIPAGAAAPR
ncbi:protease complex subunit PrcB family protein [Algihabitans albus]|uniref:protease complex subunit PrcB family protein n=1 Tax=Algihabitans albus TaxID=2164067 RepID=UPI000E5D808E|nr:protease complex subunit PrcB family protein [Algihabitans albus]